MTVIVRPAKSVDIPTLARLAAATFPLACPPGSTADDQTVFIASHLSEQHFAEYLVDPKRDVLVAEQNGELIGYAMVVVAPPPASAPAPGATVELSKCYVLPGHHGAGVSQALMTAARSCGEDRGAARMWLGVNQMNERAQRFYTRSGFTVAGTKQFQVGGRLEDDFVMVTDLAVPTSDRSAP